VKRLGLSLLEVAIAVTILAALVIPAFELFSVQRHQVGSSERELLLNGYALQRLAEEESRLNIAQFVYPYPAGASSTTTPPVGMPPMSESVSIAPISDTTGLWQINIQLVYKDQVSGPTQTVSLTRLVVDRDLPTRVPGAARP
jgi:hypothetical protein